MRTTKQYCKPTHLFYGWCVWVGSGQYGIIAAHPFYIFSLVNDSRPSFPESMYYAKDLKNPIFLFFEKRKERKMEFILFL